MSKFAGARFSNLFPTPFMALVWPDTASLNDELRDRILAEAALAAGVAKTNVGGWHSEPGQLEFCGNAGRSLIRLMYEMADETTRRVLAEQAQPPRPLRWTLHAWANVNGNGDFNSTHTHPGATWSGTYYIDEGDPPADAVYGTALQLFDPCQGRTNGFLPSFTPPHILVRPQPGLMVLFPSYVPHTVFPHRGSRPRISIAFNLRREPYP